MPATHAPRGAALPFTLIASLSLAVLPARAAGQGAGIPVRGGLVGIYAAPIGEFEDFVDQGWGFGLHGVLPLDRDGIVGLRADGAYLVYGHERKSACLSQTVGCRIVVDVNTTNSIALAGLGPELSLPAGPLRPYVNARAGFAYIATTSSVEGTRTDEDFASTTNLDDFVFSWGAGGGLAVAFSRTVGMDIGLTWLDNGRARYLREGDIVDEPDGSIILSPVRSETDLVLFHVGISFGRRLR